MITVRTTAVGIFFAAIISSEATATKELCCEEEFQPEKRCHGARSLAFRPLKQFIYFEFVTTVMVQ